jgi:hypothetical protein
MNTITTSSETFCSSFGKDVILELHAAGLLYATAQLTPRGLHERLEAHLWSLYVSRAADADALAEHRWVVKWAVAGQRSGHEWRSCSTCGQARLVARGSRRRCGMTVYCDGVMERLVPWPRRTKRLLASLEEAT